MNILVISIAMPEREKIKVFESGKIKKNEPAHKFFKLMSEGLAALNDVSLKHISITSVSPKTHRSFYWHGWEECENGIDYEASPFLNGYWVRWKTQKKGCLNICKKWCKDTKESDRVVIIDPLLGHMSKQIRKFFNTREIKVISVVTDIPQKWLQIGKDKGIKAIISSYFQKQIQNDLQNYDGYVFLTEKMNEVVNTLRKPYLVCEGFTEKIIKEKSNMESYDIRIMYLGGLFKKYNVVGLADAFLNIKKENVTLEYYGAGDAVEEIKERCERDNRIVYKGTVDVSKVIDIELSADVLINPRPMKDDYTAYSFPSKILEYMSTGTTVVTTSLACFPECYKSKMIMINEEGNEAIERILRKVIFMSKKELNKFGQKSKVFVLERTSKEAQAKRIVALIKTLV